MASKNESYSLPAFIIAGAPAEPEFERRYGVKYRCEVPIAGRAMLLRVLDALSASPRVKGIYIIGYADSIEGASILKPRGSFLDNLLVTVEAEPAAKRLLIVTSDIPMLTSAAVTSFIELCGDMSADFYYPIIPKEVNEHRLPGIRRTYARLAEGMFTGGNMVIINPRMVLQNAGIIGDILLARKHPMKIARLIGLGTLFRAAFAQKVWPGALSIARLEHVAGRIFNGKVKAVPVEFPEIGADVDSPEQAETIERLIKQKQEGERR
ncbi:MAG: NTP transferase domain-containing protein [Armatimonadetes bacterium]|nr:NTP transferase domain-containing protein [Armatimonadota bacterium]